MKIGTSLWGFRQLELPEVMAFCAECGITSIEAQAHAQAPKHFRLDMSDAELTLVRRLAAKLGITLHALALANDFTTTEAERMPGEIERVLAGLELARRLEITRVRIFAGWKKPADVDEAMILRMIDALSTVADRAADLGIRVGLENHGGITATSADVRRILDTVGRPSLGSLFDAVNFVRCDEDALVSLRALRSSIVYTHAKDLTPAKAVCAVGQGTLPWAALVRELSSDPDALVVIEQTDPATVHEMTRASFAALRSYIEAGVEVGSR
jgi:sugar phosphate isomerase/epimerase